ncbi:unnamed protein product [Prunus armeniaca]
MASVYLHEFRRFWGLNIPLSRGCAMRASTLTWRVGYNLHAIDPFFLFPYEILYWADNCSGPIHGFFGPQQEIFSSWTHKTEHIQRIHATTGLPFSSMLFFDDEDRNIQTVSKMGVTSILVGNGVNLGALRQGLLEFSRKSASSSRRML